MAKHKSARNKRKLDKFLKKHPEGRKKFAVAKRKVKEEKRVSEFRSNKQKHAKKDKEGEASGVGHS